MLRLVAGTFKGDLAFLSLQISGLPKHGSIERSEGNAFHVVLEFPTEDVGNGQIFYKHDDSESMHDKVVYELYKDNATEPFQKGEVRSQLCDHVRSALFLQQ